MAKCEKELGELIIKLEGKLNELDPGTEDYEKVSKCLSDLYGIRNESRTVSNEMFKNISNIGLSLGTMATNVFLVFKMLKFEETGMIKDPMWKNLPRFKWPNW
jgi:hypothetical protein